MSGSGVALALSPHGVLICGVEEDPDIQGAVRVYVGPRYRQQYFLTQGDMATEAKRAWAASYTGHLVADARELPAMIDGSVGGP